MHKTSHCPDCAADVMLPSSPTKRAVQCPSCKRYFTWITSAVTADAPRSIPSTTQDHAPSDHPIRLQPLRELGGTWCAMMARLSIAASVAAFIMPIAYFVYDRMLHRWLAPGVYLHNEVGNGRSTELCMLADRAEFWILATTGPAFFAFAAWMYVAARNTEFLAFGPTWPPLVVIAVLFLLLVNAVMLYIILQEIWRASDPVKLGRSDWRAPSWLVRAWGISLITAILLFMRFILVNDLGQTWTYGIAAANIAVTGILLTIIIRLIMGRQQERYHHFFEE